MVGGSDGRGRDDRGRGKKVKRQERSGGGGRLRKAGKHRNGQ